MHATIDALPRPPFTPLLSLRFVSEFNPRSDTRSHPIDVKTVTERALWKTEGRGRRNLRIHSDTAGQRLR